MRSLTSWMWNGLLIAGCIASANAQAETLVQALTDEKYTGPTVEDQVALMDTDKNGFADVFEVRAYLQTLHGADYQRDLLDKLVASAQGKSCSTPFAKELYSEAGYSNPVAQP